MRFPIFTTLATFVLLSACKEVRLSDIDFQNEINQLETVDLQQAYLEEMYRVDQKARTNETEAQEMYGYDSPEHKAAWEIIKEVDEANLKKLNLYLDKFGHPSKDLHGATAAMTPWIIIHHSSNLSSARHDHFHHMYRAFRKGDIDDGAFTFYMNRWYDFANGERLKLQSPFRVEMEIDTLIKSMNMQAERQKIDFEFETVRPLKD